MRKKSRPEKRKSPAAALAQLREKNDPMPPKGSYLENVYSLYGEQANVASQPSTQKTKKERSSGFQSYLKGKENHVKCDSSWNGTSLKRFNMKCESSWKGQFLNKNHIKYDRSSKGKNGNDFTSNVKVPEKGKLLKRNRIKYAGSWKGQILKRFHTSNVKVPERENFWKEIASKCIKYNGSWKGQIWKRFHTSNVKVPEREKFWKEITSYVIALGKGKKLY